MDHCLGSTGRCRFAINDNDYSSRCATLIFNLAQGHALHHGHQHLRLSVQSRTDVDARWDIPNIPLQLGQGTQTHSLFRFTQLFMKMDLPKYITRGLNKTSMSRHGLILSRCPWLQEAFVHLSSFAYDSCGWSSDNRYATSAFKIETPCSSSGRVLVAPCMRLTSCYLHLFARVWESLCEYRSAFQWFIIL